MTISDRMLTFAGRIRRWYQLPLEIGFLYGIGFALGDALWFRGLRPGCGRDLTFVAQALVLALAVRLGFHPFVLGPLGLASSAGMLWLSIHRLSPLQPNLRPEAWQAVLWDLQSYLPGAVIGSLLSTGWAIYRRLHIELLPWRLEPIGRAKL